MENGLFSPEGRIRRRTYWTRHLVAFLGIMLVAVISSAIQFEALYYLAAILYVIFNIIQGVKRMHDVNMSGWFLFFPAYNLILALSAGDTGPNEYGADPKGNQ